MRETHQPPTTSPANPPHDHTPGATALLPPSTEIDTIRQSPTNHNENSCPHAHAREASPPVIPAKAGIPSLGMEIAPRSQRIGCIARSYPPRTVMPIDRTEPERLSARQQRVTDWCRYDDGKGLPVTRL